MNVQGLVGLGETYADEAHLAGLDAAAVLACTDVPPATNVLSDHHLWGGLRR